MTREDFLLIAGTSNPDLAVLVAAELGVPLASCRLARHPDGEIDVELLESVRRQEVVVIQPTSPPVDLNLLELLAVADACRRAAAARITAVVPYFGYARSDRRAGRRCSINAHLAASLMQATGIDHVITVDLHADQIEGFFDIPVDEISAVPAIADDLQGRVEPDLVVVSPDEGRVRMAGEYAHLLGAEVAVLHKRRSGDRKTEVARVVGEVRDRPCLIVDDMISTGSTVDAAVTALLEAGARPGIAVAATHGLLLPGARQRLARPEIAEVLVSDTVAILDPCFRELSPGTVQAVRIVSMAPALAQLLGRVLTSSLHDGC